MVDIAFIFIMLRICLKQKLIIQYCNDPLELQVCIYKMYDIYLEHKTFIYQTYQTS